LFDLDFLPRGLSGTVCLAGDDGVGDHFGEQNTVLAVESGALPVGDDQGDRNQVVTANDRPDQTRQRRGDIGALVRRKLDLGSSVLACGKFHVPPRIIAALALAQRDLLGEQPVVGGVEVGGRELYRVVNRLTDNTGKSTQGGDFLLGRRLVLALDLPYGFGYDSGLAHLVSSCGAVCASILPVSEAQWKGPGSLRRVATA